jgi:hypothetical protein
MTWRCFLNVAGNAGFGVLAGYGLVYAVGGAPPLVFEGMGLVFGSLAGAASCL